MESICFYPAKRLISQKSMTFVSLPAVLFQGKNKISTIEPLTYKY
jgi:hypothetical protein